MIGMMTRPRNGTTSRFKVERPLPDDRDWCLVAFVGCRLAAIGRGLLERWELRPIELPTLDEAQRVLGTLIVDAIVFDAHHEELKRSSPAFAEVLELAFLCDGHRKRPAVLVLTASGVTREVTQAYRHLGAVFLRRPHQSYRALGMTLRRLCGLPNVCG